nr:hypothetical protein [Tanacetum cinerariifolium]
LRVLVCAGEGGGSWLGTYGDSGGGYGAVAGRGMGEKGGKEYSIELGGKYCAQCFKPVGYSYGIFTALVHMVHDVTRLQALVDKKKVVVTEAAIREWKFLIHTILLSMSAKRTSWNEFSSAMASAVICLSTGRKFNFSKYIFDSLVRNVDSTSKFYMYPRFLQLLIRKQVGDLSTHTTKYALPTLTHKVFANMRRVGKGFSEVETPLFEGMLVGQEIKEGGDEEEHVEDVTAGDATQGDDTAAHGEVPIFSQEPSIPSPTPPPQPPQDLSSTSQLKRRVKKLKKGNRVRVLKLRRLKRVGTSQRIDTSDDTMMDDESNQGRIIDEMDKDDVVALMDDKEEDKKDEEAMVVKNDQVQGRQAESQAEIYRIDMDHASKVLKVVTAASETVTAASTIIFTTEPQVPAATITAAPAKVVAAPSKRRKGVVIMDPEEESTTSSIIPVENKSKDKGKWIMVEEPKPLKTKQQIEMNEEYARKLHAELNEDIGWDVVIDHVKLKAKEDPAVQRYQVMNRKPQTEAQAQKNMMMYLKNVAGFKLDYFKGMSYDDIRPIFEAKFNSNIASLLKTKEQMEKEENRALQSINETPAQKAAKRRKLNEKVEDLKRHLEIVPDEDDDVYTEATLLARKVLVVDYEIIEINNKPYYKIIRADGTHQLYISFLTLLKNFDREDLEAL